MLINFSVMATPFTSKCSVIGAVPWLISPLLRVRAGRQYVDDMTPAKAARVRADRIEGRRESRKEKREAEKAAKIEKAGKWTLSSLWEEYQTNKADSKAIKTDRGRFEKHIKPSLGIRSPMRSSALTSTVCALIFLKI
jgi:hypothetical protein